MHWGLPLVVLTPWLLAGGCITSSSACSGDSDCDADGRSGMCQTNGWCSYPDPDCTSGQRYGDQAGNELAGKCVYGGGGSESSSTITDASTLSASSLESTATLESSDTADGSSSTTQGTGTDSDTTASSSTGDAGVCGDGMMSGTEECDDGEANGMGGPCRDDCVLTVCGDGYVGGEEACEPEGDDDCTPRCTLRCGNGVIDDGEVCDGVAVPVGEDCTDHGFVSGTLGCATDCSAISTAECNGCGDSCDFDVCDDGCDENEICAMYAGGTGSTCTAECMIDEDCPSPYIGAICVDGECTIPCMSEEDCPSVTMQCYELHCAHAT